jgi:hypothetical protein
MRRILILILSTVNIGDIWKGLAKKHSSPTKKYTKNVKKIIMLFVTVHCVVGWG